MTTATETSIEELRFRLAGGLHEPGEPEFEDACTLYSSSIETRPRYVTRCVSVDDVIAVLGFAREHDAQIAVRAGGHSGTGASLVEVTFEPDGGGTVLRLRHSRLVPEAVGGHAEGWNYFLGRLTEALADA